MNTRQKQTNLAHWQPTMARLHTKGMACFFYIVMQLTEQKRPLEGSQKRGIEKCNKKDKRLKVLIKPTQLTRDWRR